MDEAARNPNTEMLEEELLAWIEERTPQQYAESLLCTKTNPCRAKTKKVGDGGFNTNKGGREKLMR